MRDVSTPLDHRFHAVKYCVEYESPLGYEGTSAYLEAATGLRREEPGFLDVALDLVERQRRARQEIETRYAAARRSLKRAGMRAPHPHAVTPWQPPRWHGDERTGAQHALATWLDRRASQHLLTHPEAARAVAAARVAVNNHVHELDVDSLQRGLDWARKEIEVGYRPERSDYGRRGRRFSSWARSTSCWTVSSQSAPHGASCHKRVCHRTEPPQRTPS